MDKVTEAAVLYAQNDPDNPKEHLPQWILDRIRDAVIYGAQFNEQKWIDVREQQPEEGQDCMFIVEAKGDYYDGRVLGGKYQRPHMYDGKIMWYEFTTPGCSWAATLWQPSPSKPE